MNNEKFELIVQVYEELLPYKDFFDCALHYVHRKHLTDERFFCVDYAPGENPKRKTARIKITYNETYYKELYEQIKTTTKINSDRAMVNNILSSLVGIPQFMPKPKKVQ